MLSKLKWMTLPVLFSILFCMPLRTTSASEPPGQILGGSVNSPVRLEIFSDFECPACREYYLGTIRKILEEYCSQDKVCVIYHEFPLRMHRYARQAALYTEAAYRLGRQQMLQVFDVLYTNQAEWAENGQIEETISKALTAEDFKKVKSLAHDPSVINAIEDEVRFGTDKGIMSTPTTYIYYIGKQQKVEGVITHLILKGFIDKIVK